MMTEADLLFRALARGIYDPKFFGDITPEQFDELHEKIRLHLEKLPNGCPAGFFALFTGEAGRSQQRLDEISKLALLNPDATREIFVAVNLISIGSSTPTAMYEKLRDAYLKGTGGEILTGNPQIDRNNLRVIRFALLYGALILAFRNYRMGRSRKDNWWLIESL